MALSKRNSRTIQIDDVEYRWAVSPDSGYMWLIVELAASPGQRIEASFDYHDEARPDGHGSAQCRSISPGVVRTVVLHALASGWRPRQRGLKALRVDGKAVPDVPLSGTYEAP
jgi:hypothetical protein